MPRIFEGIVRLDNYEDRGDALITDLETDDDDPNGMFIRLQSWDEREVAPQEKHTELKALLGKKVRITIEPLE